MYGYFVRRCGDRGTAEDLTSETFLAAMDAARKEAPPPMTVPWLIGVARHKLADHYRRRHDRFTVPVAELPEPVDPADDWDAELDRIVAESVLARLPEQHRTVLALRYMDDCSRAGVRRVDRPHRARHRGTAGAGTARVQSAVPTPGRRDVVNDNHDPLTVLRGDDLPVAARSGVRGPAAVAPGIGRGSVRTSTRIEHKESIMSGTDTAIAELTDLPPRSTPPPRPAALPYLAVADARAAIAWYIDTFGAALVGEPIRDGRRPHRARRAARSPAGCSTSPTSIPNSA